MLKDPFLNEPFEPSLTWFVSRFDVYDREETRGVELGVYNPDDPVDREVLIRKYCLVLPYLSYRHKCVLFDFLERALEDPKFDFQRPFEIDECEANSWPREEWYSLNEPRSFFQSVYQLAREVWKEDLSKAAGEEKTTW
ncbi:hypothetical protein LOY52_08335 [Pseudomonas sp. B21-051]|uniref:hypothetical protein n=1 Tax=Pseudomonas sp. B21-051 TaxID=2895491 RepID=UPI00215FF0EF|nr:hypothetical protein [Pseudomonas sp. B21-051]UVK90070.1 hypothetical protein LOY52_08335 [Pseudomonas sp. B21-051]